MKINSYYFDDNIKTNTVKNLVDKLSEFEGVIDLWFSTDGGDHSSMKYLLNYLNSRKDEIRIALTGRLCSSGTLLLSDFKGKIKINKLDFIMFHMFDRQRYPLRKYELIDDDIIQNQDMKGNIKLADKFRRKKILNKKQIKQFLKGKDVVLYRKDFKQLNLNKNGKRISRLN